MLSNTISSKTFGTGEKAILVVEDDDRSYALTEIAFEEVGGDFRVYRAEDGAQALAFLRHSGTYDTAPTPDLVLLNLNMPRVSGFDVLEAIHDDPSIKDVPVVVFSSSRLDHDKARCLALGARAFLTKPSDLDQLIETVRDICSLV